MKINLLCDIAEELANVNPSAALTTSLGIKAYCDIY